MDKQQVVIERDQKMQETRLVEREVSLLDAGDTVLVGTTHEISVGRDKAWIKGEVTVRVRPGELPGTTTERAVEAMEYAIKRNVAETVERMRSNYEIR